MRAYACTIVPLEDLVIFYEIKRIIQKFPEVDLGEEEGRKIKVSCHMLARAFASFFPLNCRDGYFAGCCKHSWLTTRAGLILDVYPVGVVGGPLLLDTRFAVSWSSLYKEEQLLFLEEASFLERARIVTEAVGLIIEQQGR